MSSLLPFLVFLLLLSGFCGLVYQVLWLRLLALTFGVTVYAAAAVLASFMGGLALGSLVAGRLVDRTRHPLRLFGIIEILIGLCAAASPLVLGGLQSLMIAAAPSLPDSVAVDTVIRVAMSALVLLIPTTLMGATMPVVIKSSLTRSSALGPRVGALYAANTTGAIVGTLVAGFYLIPRIGLTRAFLLAAGVNITVGVVALIASRWVPEEPVLPVQQSAPSDVVPVRQAPASAVVSSLAARTALLVAAISGFASLALEVVWFRLMAIFMGPTSYTFTVVLATVLAGIAAGSALASPLLRLRRVDWVLTLALVQLVGASLVLASVSGIVTPIEAGVWIQGALHRAGIAFAVPALSMSLVVVLPSALFFGVSFPLALRLWVSTDEVASDTGRRVGVFYAVNLGAGIFGSLLAGFLLLPTLGSRDSIVLLAFLYVAGGLIVLATCARRRPFFTGLAAAGLVGLVLQAQGVPDPLDVMHRRIYTGRPVIWQNEGVQTTVAVVGGTNSRVMFLDGRHQANDAPGMLFIHRRIGLLPTILHPRPERALVVGLGGGATPGGMSQIPGLTVDVVELSQGVINGAAYFQHVNFDILNNPNVRLMVDDGRNFLQRVRTGYDVITADAIVPRHAGANSLNSVEYFTLVRQALRPGGLALHWNGGATSEEHRLILSAFAAAFPHVSLWGDGSLMLGSMDPVTISRAHIERLLADPQTRHVLALMNVEQFDHLERMFRADDAVIRAYVAGTAPLSDNRPLLEYFESLPQTERDLTALPRRPEVIFRP
jgi:spermidine synthase